MSSFITTSFTIRGNLTKDAEIRQAGKDLYAVNMDVAVTSRVKVGNEWKNSDTAFYKIVKFVQKKAFFEKAAVKGAPILATGTIDQKTWENKEGKKQTSYEFTVNNLEFLVRPAKAEKVEEPAPADTADIPF